MSSRRSGRTILRVGAVLVSAALGLMAAGSVFAGSGSADPIHTTTTGTLSVTASGTWSWAEMATAKKLSYAGFAIDWGDVSSGNAVGSYHIGDGTAATNVVLQPTDPAQGSSGSWGPVSHTYAQPGSYQVCVILYDLGQLKPFKTTGYHSLQAGGTGRNTDNSVDDQIQVPAMCTTVELAAPTPTVAPTVEPTRQPTAPPTSEPTTAPSPTPFESFQGETATPPSTGTAGTPPSAPDQGLPILPLVLLFGSSLSSMFVLKTVRVRR